jgi:hypothetical protein
MNAEFSDEMTMDKLERQLDKLNKEYPRVPHVVFLNHSPSSG